MQSGETLYGIAWLYGLDYQVLANNNALEEPYALNVGQTLELMNKPVKKIVSSADISKPVANVVKTPVVANNKKTDTMRTHPTTKKSALEQIPKRVKRWQWPAEGTLISTFSTAEAGVRGIEIANKSGTPVVSAADGKVVYSGNALRGYGNLIIIKHTNKFLSAYAHNSKILVKERDFVQAGEQIAIMGDSGTNSIKLRFEIRYNGKSLDPLKTKTIFATIHKMPSGSPGMGDSQPPKNSSVTSAHISTTAVNSPIMNSKNGVELYST